MKEDDVLVLRNVRQPSTSATGNAMSSWSSLSNNPASSAAAPAPDGSIDSAAEYARAQILQDPNLMRQLEQSEPEIANAARNDPARFKEWYNARGERYAAMEREKHQMEELLMADPFDIEAQKKIEEAIRQQQVLENMEHAMEFSPESFGRVTMLYVNVEVNGQPVKAFVDSGAQATISKVLSGSFSKLTEVASGTCLTCSELFSFFSNSKVSPDCAERCGYVTILTKQDGFSLLTTAVQDHAFARHEILGHRARCRDCSHPRQNS